MRLLVGAGIIVLLVAGVVLGTILARQESSSDVPTPKNWRQMKQFGKIADPCLGGWNECGSITTIYDTRESSGNALTQLTAALTSAGWVLVINSSSPVAIDAEARNRADNWDKIGHIILTNSQARIEYIHQ